MADIAKIDTLIQSSPHPAWLATTQGHCVHANVALERLTGFNSDQIHQADWRSFLLEEDRAVASASSQWSLVTGTPYRVQVRSQPLDRFRVRGSQLCRLLLLLAVTFNRSPLLLGQTPASARLHVDLNSWTFNDGAPADVACLAQTNDGFLWLGGPTGCSALMERDSNLSGRRLAIGSSRPTRIPCLGRRLAACGWVTRSGASAS
jgi:PAS domain-containing protein